MTAASSEVSNLSVRSEVLVCTRRMTQNSVDGSDLGMPGLIGVPDNFVGFVTLWFNFIEHLSASHNEFLLYNAHSHERPCGRLVISLNSNEAYFFPF